MPLLLGVDAAACDLPIFSLIPAPDGADVDVKAFATGATSFRGAEIVGGRVMTVSRHTLAEWKAVLLDPEHQDDWQAARFGNTLSERIDANHLYMRLDIPLAFGALHIRRQIVADFRSFQKGDSYRSCWQVIDPAPWRAEVARWDDGTEWESDTYGCWDLTPRPDGTTLVSYQWWSDLSAYPSAVGGWVVSHTLPDMVDAFEARVGLMAGR